MSAHLERLQSIQAMLAAGHRCVELERHSLLIWGEVGGGIMVYALWTVLLGLGIFVFGLFSRPVVEWIGLAAILLGIVGLASGLPLSTARWLAASAFAVGLPVAGWLAARSDDRRVGQRALHVLLWLAAVILPALIVTRVVPTAATATLKLPAGSPVPLYIDRIRPKITSDTPEVRMHGNFVFHGERQ